MRKKLKFFIVILFTISSSCSNLIKNNNVTNFENLQRIKNTILKKKHDKLFNYKYKIKNNFNKLNVNKTIQLFPFNKTKSDAVTVRGSVIIELVDNSKLFTFIGYPNQRIRINQTSNDFSDAYLRIYDSTGNLLAQSDDTENSLDSFIEYKILSKEKPSQYIIEASSYIAPNKKGNFKLSGNFNISLDIFDYNNESNWINSIYNDLLLRNAHLSEIKLWLRQRADNNLRPLDVVNSLLHNKEYTERIVNNLYKGILGRNAEPSGLISHSNMMLNPKYYINDLIINLITSQEYNSLFPTDESFIESLYKRLLLRDPDIQGLKAHLALLKSGYSRETEINYFLHSDEYCRTTVKNLYLKYLKRSSDQDGENIYTNYLLTGGNIDELIKIMLISYEYRFITSNK